MARSTCANTSNTYLASSSRSSNRHSYNSTLAELCVRNNCPSCDGSGHCAHCKGAGSIPDAESHDCVDCRYCCCVLASLLFCVASGRAHEIAACHCKQLIWCVCAAIVPQLKGSPVAGSAATVLDLAVPTILPTRAQLGLVVGPEWAS